MPSPRSRILQGVGAATLLLSFFLPWIRLPDEAFTGLRAAELAERLQPLRSLPTPDPVFAAYLIFLVPVLALVTLVLVATKRSAAVPGGIGGFLPFVILVWMWIVTGNDMLPRISVGFTLALVAGAVTLFSTVGGLRTAAIIDGFTTRLGYVMYVAALAMVTIGASYVIMRYTGRTLGFTVTGANFFRELQIFLFNMVFLLAAAYNLKENAHVRVDLVYSSLRLRAKAWVDIFGATFFLTPLCLLGLYMTHGYVMRSWRALEMSPNPGGLPLYPSKTLIIAAFLLLILQGASETAKNVAFLRGRLERSEEPHEVVVIPTKTEIL